MLYLKGFSSTIRRRGEYYSFVTSLYKLVEYCSFGELPDEMIWDRLVGTKMSRGKLQLDVELTLEKALTQARQHERVKVQQPVVRGKKLNLLLLWMLCTIAFQE